MRCGEIIHQYDFVNWMLSIYLYNVYAARLLFNILYSIPLECILFFTTNLCVPQIGRAYIVKPLLYIELANFLFAYNANISQIIIRHIHRHSIIYIRLYMYSYMVKIHIHAMMTIIAFEYISIVCVGRCLNNLNKIQERDAVRCVSRQF